MPGQKNNYSTGNNTKEMDYLNDLISKWMPPDSPRVAVNSHPSVSGILDTTNATLAHGTATRLPKEFYDEKGLEILSRISSDEWFTGYKESSEFRELGIGPLLGDVVSRMVTSVRGTSGDRQSMKGRGGEWKIKFALSGAHDTTIAGILASLGAFEGENGKWPPYTSHIAMELFRKSNVPCREPTLRAESHWIPWFYKFRAASLFNRKHQQELNVSQKGSLAGYYVRLRYNDRPIVIEGCRVPGNHLEGDESFCTLVCCRSRYHQRPCPYRPR
jgi:acid phosphatase